jgi:hypothetical protein
LQEQREQVKRRHSDALHAHCQGMIAAVPAILEEAITALQAQDRMFRQSYRPDKTPAENYAERPMPYIPIDNFLKEHYPEHFQTLHDSHNAELAALDTRIADLQQDAA